MKFSRYGVFALSVISLFYFSIISHAAVPESIKDGEQAAHEDPPSKWTFIGDDGEKISGISKAGAHDIPELNHKTGKLSLLHGSFNYKIRIEEALVDGVENGLATTYFENIKSSETEKKDGVNNGNHRVWREGVKWIEGQYSNGMRSGTWNFYFKNGNLGFQCVFIDDNINGVADAYYSMGVRAAHGEYYKGKPVNGTFIVPWQFWCTGNPYMKPFKLCEYKDGKKLSAKEIKNGVELD